VADKGEMLRDAFATLDKIICKPNNRSMVTNRGDRSQKGGLTPEVRCPPPPPPSNRNPGNKNGLVFDANKFRFARKLSLPGS
jgi:hypothetical protein